MLDNGQPQSGSAERPRASLVDAVKTLEKARQILGGNARTRVPDVELDAVIIERLRADGNTAPVRRVLDCIVKKVAQDLVDGLGITEHLNPFGQALDRQFDCLFLRQRQHRVDIVGKQRVDAIVSKFELLLAELDTRKRQQIGGETREPLGVLADDGQEFEIIVWIVDGAIEQRFGIALNRSERRT